MGRGRMKKVPFVLFGLLLALGLVAPLPAAASSSRSSVESVQDTQLNVPKTGRRRNRRRERHGGGIGHNYGKGGKSMGRGGKRFGKNIANGKPLKAGKEMGKGAGGFGKGVGKGTRGVGIKVGKKVGKATKRAFKP